MRSSLLILFLHIFLSAQFVAAQSLTLTPLQGKKRPSNIESGEVIYLKFKPGFVLDSVSNFSAKFIDRFGVNGVIEEINSDSLLFTQRNIGTIPVAYNDIEAVKKEYPLLQTSSFLILTGGSLLYLHQTDNLYFGKATLMVLASAVANKLLWNLVFNPRKNIRTRSNKGEKTWELSVVN